MVKVMVGAPVSQRWADEIGADGYARTRSALSWLATSLGQIADS
jgi:methanogenic corrinoid protein MtbC1